MKLSLLSYGLGSEWSLAEMIGVAKRIGFSGLDFRCEYGHRHGVEVGAGRPERSAIRRAIDTAYLKAVCLRCSARFDNPDPGVREANVENAKLHVQLAADIDASMVRVTGNDLQEGVDEDTVIRWVGEGLTEVADFAQALEIDVLLEMHGDFNNWRYATRAVRLAAQTNVGLLYNSDPRDLVGQSVRPTIREIAGLVRHVDLHDLGGSFPYAELLRELRAAQFDGYYCLVTPFEAPSKEDYLTLYRQLMATYFTAVEANRPA